jgi:hypothetical protein
LAIVTAGAACPSYRGGRKRERLCHRRCGKSVTALEIEYGLLKKDPHFRTNCLFLFRDPLPYDRMLETPGPTT